MPDRVLNAFRHHGVSRQRLWYDTNVTKECSTPFGITEFRGPALPRLRQPSCGRAQRLSASRSFAGVRTSSKADGEVMCSTPFGITEFRGPEEHRCPPSIPTCSTPFGITEFRGLSLEQKPCLAARAQRLSASRSFAVRSSQGVVDHQFTCPPFKVALLDATHLCEMAVSSTRLSLTNPFPNHVFHLPQASGELSKSNNL